MIEVERQQRQRDREVLMEEAGRERALLWRIMDGMERRRQWHERKRVLRSWRTWFTTHVKARVKRMLAARRGLRRTFLRWVKVATAERECEREIAVALEAQLEKHREKERKSERERESQDDTHARGITLNGAWSGLAGVDVGEGVGKGSYLPPSPSHTFTEAAAAAAARVEGYEKGWLRCVSRLLAVVGGSASSRARVHTHTPRTQLEVSDQVSALLSAALCLCKWRLCAVVSRDRRRWWAVGQRWRRR